MVVYCLVLDWNKNCIRFAQNTTQTLIGCQLKTTSAFMNVVMWIYRPHVWHWACSSLDISLQISSLCEPAFAIAAQPLKTCVPKLDQCLHFLMFLFYSGLQSHNQYQKLISCLHVLEVWCVMQFIMDAAESKWFTGKNTTQSLFEVLMICMFEWPRLKTVSITEIRWCNTYLKHRITPLH